MPKLIFLPILLAGLVILTNPAQAAPCIECRTMLPENVGYCGVCGASQAPLSVPSPEKSDTNILQDSLTIQPPSETVLKPLSDDELRRMIAILLENSHSNLHCPVPDSNSVGQMSRAELESLLKKYRSSEIIQKQTGLFAGFLQFIGAGTLVIVFIIIIAA